MYRKKTNTNTHTQNKLQSSSDKTCMTKTSTQNKNKIKSNHIKSTTKVFSTFENEMKTSPKYTCTHTHAVTILYTTKLLKIRRKISNGMDAKKK